jgi:hypothetical protein
MTFLTFVKLVFEDSIIHKNRGSLLFLYIKYYDPRKIKVLREKRGV